MAGQVDSNNSTYSCTCTVDLISTAARVTYVYSRSNCLSIVHSRCRASSSSPLHPRVMRGVPQCAPLRNVRLLIMVDFFTPVEKKKKRGRPKGSTAVRRGPNVSRKNTGAPNKAAEASYEAPKQSMRGKRKTNEKASHCPGCQWARAGGLHSHHCLQP